MALGQLRAQLRGLCRGTKPLGAGRRGPLHAIAAVGAGLRVGHRGPHSLGQLLGSFGGI